MVFFFIKYVPLLKVLALFNHRKIKVEEVSICHLVKTLPKSKVFKKELSYCFCKNLS